MIISFPLNIYEHLKFIARKITYVTNQLTCVRRKSNLKLNINLYKVCILPLYRLGFAFYSKVTKKQQNDLILSIKKSLKIFLCFPRNTSNNLLLAIFGDIELYIGKVKQESYVDQQPPDKIPR